MKKGKEESGFFRRLREIFPNATKSQLADKLEIKPSAITPYVRGRLPGLVTLMKISLLTGASIHWLVTGKGEKLANPYDEYLALEQSEEKMQTREPSVEYHAPGRHPIAVCFGVSEQRLIMSLAAKSGRTIEDQIRELVLESLIERLKEKK